MFAGLRRLIEQRAATPEFSGGSLIGFRSKNPCVLGFTRPAPQGGVLVLANFSEHPQAVAAAVLAALPEEAVDLIAGKLHSLRQDLALAPYQLVWLDCRTP